MAYADPPYPGNSRRYYGDHADFGGEVDHEKLLSRLTSYDTWALSTSAAALPDVLSLCAGESVRVAAWFRGARPHATARLPVSSWEPVVYAGARRVGQDLERRVAASVSGRRIDSLVYVARARTTDQARVVGAKPAEFYWWLFDLLGLAACDEYSELFPGSGGGLRAWELFSGPAGDASPGPVVDVS